MQKNYPVLYNQNDYPGQLGSANVTIAQDGCFDSCLAMKACFYGHTITPPDLNTLFDQNQVYVNENGVPYKDGNGADLLPDNALAKVYTDINYVKTFDYEPIPTDLNNIKNLLSDPATTVTIRIKFASGGYHFVEAVDCDGTVLHIANPWTGVIEDFAKNYGDPITANLHVIVYTGPVTTPITIRFNQAIQKSNNFDTVSDFLGITPEQRVTTAAGLIVVEKIKQLQDDLHTLGEENQKLTEQIQELQKADNAAAPIAPTDTPSVVPVVAPVVNQPQFSDGKPAVSSTTSPALPEGSIEAKIGQKGNVFVWIWATLKFWLW